MASTPEAAASASIRLARSARIIACAAARSAGSKGDAAVGLMQGWNHSLFQTQGKELQPTEVGRQASTGLGQSIPQRK